MTREIKVAHSPDSDDAFMFYALATDKLDTGELHFTHVLRDIQSLNQVAMTTREYDVTAVSFHAYAYIADNYILLPHGASIGDGYGPIVVARDKFPAEELKSRRIAGPGTLTSAYLALRLHTPEFEFGVVPFDEIIGAVLSGEYDAGLLIHEGQLTFGTLGLHLITDLGVWWQEKTGLPLPLGGNVVRRDLGHDVIIRVSRLLRQSIQYALDHRNAALEYALRYGRDLDTGLADRFVGMYVNHWTLDYGERGRAAVRELLRQGAEAGIVPALPSVDFVNDS